MKHQQLGANWLVGPALSRQTSLQGISLSAAPKKIVSYLAPQQ